VLLTCQGSYVTGIICEFHITNPIHVLVRRVLMDESRRNRCNANEQHNQTLILMALQPKGKIGNHTCIKLGDTYFRQDKRKEDQAPEPIF
jgi:hypothetical protein